MRVWLARFQSTLAELTPRQVALVLSVGLVLGVFPVVGCPTVLCLLAAIGLRLNPAALQVVNNISSPLQLALLLPLARAGARLCGAAPAVGNSWAVRCGATALCAIAGWACICIPAGGVLYVSLLLAMRWGRAWQAAR